MKGEMAALNNLESGFNAKLVLSQSHAVSRALLLTQGDKTIHNQLQSSDYSYPSGWCHRFVYPISLQVVLTASSSSKTEIWHLAHYWHPRTWSWSQVRGDKKNTDHDLAPRTTQEQSSSWYDCYTLRWAIGFHTVLLISKHQSLLVPIPYFKSSIPYILFWMKCYFLIDGHNNCPYLKVERSKIHQVI